jgi:hypothetical protein
MDCLIKDEYDGEDMPAIEWNREAPELGEGTISNPWWTVGMQ